MPVTFICFEFSLFAHISIGQNIITLAFNFDNRSVVNQGFYSEGWKHLLKSSLLTYKTDFKVDIIFE